MAAFSQDKIRRIVSDMEHKSWKRKNNTGVPEEVIHHPGAGVEVPLLHFPLLEKTGIVKEGFTTRLGGVSEGIFATMNLSFTRGDEEEAVRENYRRLASALDVDYDKFVFIREVIQNALDATKLRLWQDLKNGMYDFAIKRKEVLKEKWCWA
mgnify:CR=1 FL=1